MRDAITVDELRFEVEELLLSAGREAAEWKRWRPALAQVRISKADTQIRGASESPERQLRHIARYCVEFEFRPEALCFEAQSGHLTDKKPRRLFEDYRQRIEDGSLAVEAVLTYNIDRFTRDRYIGERWLSTLKKRGIDLHEVDEMEPPLPLHRREEEYARAFLGAWRESVRTSKRVRDVQVALVQENRLLSSVDSYGHKPVWQNDGQRRRQVAGTIVEREADVLREATRRVHAGEALYSIVVDFNDRGLRGRKGGKFTNNTLAGLLTSPRLAGMQRLDGETVNAPIEPILSVEDWQRNCELLAVKKPRGRRVEYPMSGLGVCAACGSPVKASGGYYRCSGRNRGLNTRRHCETCQMPNGRCMCSGKPTAVDGKIHGQCRVEALDRFLVEVALAAHDAEWAAREAEQAHERMNRDATQRADCQARLDALNEERRTLARQERQGFITPEEAAAELQDIVERTKKVRHELADLRARQSTVLAVDPKELREQTSNGSVEFIRMLVSRVIDHYVLHPSGPNSGHPYDGIEIVFAADYQPPTEAVEALRAELTAEAERRYRLDHVRPGQGTEEDENLALMLWQQGLTTVQVAEQFNAWRRPTPKAGTGGTWTETTVRRIVQRACERQGIPYVARKRSTVKYSHEMRDLIYELAREQRRWDEIAAEVNRMGVKTWDGQQWTAQRVKVCYASECARRGEKPRGRRPGLPAEMRRLIRLRKRVQGQTYAQIAEWLNTTGAQRPNRKPWDRKAVEFIVAQEDARIAAAEANGDESTEAEAA